jgi:hypothetical protein
MSFRPSTSWRTPLRVIAATAAVAAIALPLTARTQADASATQIYQQERANCLAGKTSQSQADCLYEARSVLRDRRAGALEPGADAAYAASPGTAYSADALPPRADRN